ncbi:hypothetical protein HYPBUDRAFT_150472 [Hyphopichia burtonii NRRL Y-1933]|uniref:HTH APSES-type domain-containing protein n=2 Tax=Dikarya TaxID=451864 RepID=A0A1E4RCY1_9ASCO|nr:hypothetical protein HYPBUDRAFT_150472 [Hyphopichia burtonii NRRL Y-1933]ODV65083.1 hypothetical protein HYPBUDRAFT_150472 [Hyphopichia burtonii NRRL Y-1933]
MIPQVSYPYQQKQALTLNPNQKSLDSSLTPRLSRFSINASSPSMSSSGYLNVSPPSNQTLNTSPSYPIHHRHHVSLPPMNASTGAYLPPAMSDSLSQPYLYPPHTNRVVAAPNHYTFPADSSSSTSQTSPLVDQYYYKFPQNSSSPNATAGPFGSIYFSTPVVNQQSFQYTPNHLPNQSFQSPPSDIQLQHQGSPPHRNHGVSKPKEHKRKKSRSSPNSKGIPLINKFLANPISNVNISNHQKSSSLPSYNTVSSPNDSKPYSYAFAIPQDSGPKMSVMGSVGSNKDHHAAKINFPICQLPVNEEGKSLQIPFDKSNDLKNVIYPQIEIKKYSTSAIDPLRNYLVVFEYSINNHWIIWDYETGFVHLTGIWKASLNDSKSMEESSLPKSNSKADIVKLLESTPKQYHPYIKRIRGGFLKIQGTWLPFNLCKVLARRFCYHIRYELIPIFGTDFPDYCLKPNDDGFGELKLDEVPDEDSLLSNGEIRIDPTKKSPKKKRHSNPIINSNLSNFDSSHNNFDNKNYASLATPSTPVTNKVIKKDPKRKHRSNSLTSNNLPKQMLPLPTPPAKLMDSPKLLVKTDLEKAYLKSPASGTFTVGKPNEHRQLLPSCNTLPTPGSTSSHTHSKSEDNSYTDMIDIVNASKCLQSLSQSRSHHPVSLSTLSSTSNDLNSIGANSNNQGSLQTSPINYDSLSGNKNYTISSPKSNVSPESGISSILVAAGVSEERTSDLQSSIRLPPIEIGHRGANGKTSPHYHHLRQNSIKINDLLS